MGVFFGFVQRLVLSLILLAALYWAYGVFFADQGESYDSFATAVIACQDGSFEECSKYARQARDETVASTWVALWRARKAAEEGRSLQALDLYADLLGKTAKPHSAAYPWARLEFLEQSVLVNHYGGGLLRGEGSLGSTEAMLDDLDAWFSAMGEQVALGRVALLRSQLLLIRQEFEQGRSVLERAIVEWTDSAWLLESLLRQLRLVENARPLSLAEKVGWYRTIAESGSDRLLSMILTQVLELRMSVASDSIADWELMGIEAQVRRRLGDDEGSSELFDDLLGAPTKQVKDRAVLEHIRALRGRFNSETAKKLFAMVSSEELNDEVSCQILINKGELAEFIGKLGIAKDSYQKLQASTLPACRPEEARARLAWLTKGSSSSVKVEHDQSASVLALRQFCSNNPIGPELRQVEFWRSLKRLSLDGILLSELEWFYFANSGVGNVSPEISLARGLGGLRALGDFGFQRHLFYRDLDRGQLEASVDALASTPSLASCGVEVEQLIFPRPQFELVREVIEASQADIDPWFLYAILEEIARGDLSDSFDGELDHVALFSRSFFGDENITPMTPENKIVLENFVRKLARYSADARGSEVLVCQAIAQGYVPDIQSDSLPVVEEIPWFDVREFARKTTRASKTYKTIYEW